MKYILVFLLKLFVITAFSQGTFEVDPVSKRVTNFDANYQFTRSCIYDHDLRTAMDYTMVTTTVAIRIDKDGMGRLVIFVKNKVALQIDSCRKDGDTYNFYLTNAKEEPVTASLVTSQNKVTSFWLDNSKENTSIVLYK